MVSGGMPSGPAALLFFRCWMALLISALLGQFSLTSKGLSAGSISDILLGRGPSCLSCPSWSLHSKQFGFMKKRSCLSELLDIFHSWAKARNDSHKVHVILVDFTKAFYFVPRQHLVVKLKGYGISDNHLNWLNWLRFHPYKCEFLRITHARGLFSYSHKLSCCTLQSVSKTVDFVVSLTSHLSWNTQTQKVVNKVNNWLWVSVKGLSVQGTSKAFLVPLVLPIL